MSASAAKNFERTKAVPSTVVLSKAIEICHASCFNERKLQILSESIDGPETETYVSEPIVILPKAMGICHISLLSREKKILLCFHKKYASLFVLTRNKSTYPLKPKLNRKRPTVVLSKAVEIFLCFPEKKKIPFCFHEKFFLLDLQGCKAPEPASAVHVTHFRYGYSTGSPETGRQLGCRFHGHRSGLSGLPYSTQPLKFGGNGYY